MKRLPFIFFGEFEDFLRFEELAIFVWTLFFPSLSSQPHFACSQEHGAIKREVETKHTWIKVEIANNHRFYKNLPLYFRYYKAIKN